MVQETTLSEKTRKELDRVVQRHQLEKLLAFVDKHDALEITGFFWCTTYAYHCVVLASQGPGKACEAAEFHAPTHIALYKAAKKAGFVLARDAFFVKKLCESAPRSPIRRVRS